MLRHIINTEQTTAKHAIRVVQYLFFASLGLRDRKPIGRVVSFYIVCRITHVTCLSHASVSNVICPVEFGKTDTGGDTNRYLARLSSATVSRSGVRILLADTSKKRSMGPVSVGHLLVKNFMWIVGIHCRGLKRIRAL